MDTLLQNTFNNEAAIYDETTQYLILDYNSVLKQVVQQINVKKTAKLNILDVGCGTGNLLMLLRKEYSYANLYALDFSEDMLNIAKAKRIPNVKYINADLNDVESLDLPYFDVIIASFVFHNFKLEEEHRQAMNVLNKMLSVNGRLIVADLIDPGLSAKRKMHRRKLVKQMRAHNLQNAEIMRWLITLEEEDTPLTVQQNIDILHKSGYVDVHANVSNDSYSAIIVGRKKTDIIQVKAELISNGVQPNHLSKELYLAQNPKNITKTGNNGIFLTLNGLDVLVGINHTTNEQSPYIFAKREKKFILSKYGSPIDLEVRPIIMPDWAFTPIESGIPEDCFSNYFVYEGHGYIHLAYKSCSFSDDEKCKFCSVKRRTESNDNDVDAICFALETTLPAIPDDVHICLGGGTYLPVKENIAFFKKIIQVIRKHGKRNPIWVEMIPTETSYIQELIDAGATSFGFNIEIWDDARRLQICPGKSRIAKGVYLQACKYVVESLGPDSVGACLIVGLDSRENTMIAIDKLLEYGIQPCVLMYKNYDTDLGGYVVPESYQRDYVFLSNYAAKRANDLGMYFSNSQGCLKCNCCTIMHDLQMQLKKQN